MTFNDSLKISRRCVPGCKVKSVATRVAMNVNYPFTDTLTSIVWKISPRRNFNLIPVVFAPAYPQFCFLLTNTDLPP